MVYQHQDQPLPSTENNRYTNAKADDQPKIIYNGKNINNGIPTPRQTINSKLSTTEKI